MPRRSANIIYFQHARGNHDTPPEHVERNQGPGRTLQNRCRVDSVRKSGFEHPRQNSRLISLLDSRADCQVVRIASLEGSLEFVEDEVLDLVYYLGLGWGGDFYWGKTFFGGMGAVIRHIYKD